MVCQKVLVDRGNRKTVLCGKKKLVGEQFGRRGSSMIVKTSLEQEHHSMVVFLSEAMQNTTCEEKQELWANESLLPLMYGVQPVNSRVTR